MIFSLKDSKKLRFWNYNSLMLKLLFPPVFVIRSDEKLFSVNFSVGPDFTFIECIVWNYGDP